MGDNKSAMSSYKAQVEQYGVPISKEEFHELRSYAERHGVKLSGFKDFVGDIEVIKTVIDDIFEIAQDFPEILDERNGIWLELDYNLGTDFATTESGHIIHLNAVYFSNLEILKEDYSECVTDGRFVKGTDWRAIIRHEAGHVVADRYGLHPMSIALKLSHGRREANILEELGDVLSLYSVEYQDGREIISECFSAYYSRVENNYANRYVSCCQEIVKESR